MDPHTDAPISIKHSLPPGRAIAFGEQHRKVFLWHSAASIAKVDEAGELYSLTLMAMAMAIVAVLFVVVVNTVFVGGWIDSI